MAKRYGVEITVTDCTAVVWAAGLPTGWISWCAEPRAAYSEEKLEVVWRAARDPLRSLVARNGNGEKCP